MHNPIFKGKHYDIGCLYGNRIYKKGVRIEKFFNLTKEKDPIPYVESGAAIGAYKPEEIRNAIVGAKHNKKTKKFVMDWAYKSDGKATERVMELIKSLRKWKE